MLISLQAVAFMDDYDRAVSASSAFDSQLASAASSISSDYPGILAQATRQAFGTFEITISLEGSGAYNTSDVMIFSKNFGLYGGDSTGTTQSVNSVDSLFGNFPVLLYLNPELLGYLLRPILEVSDSSSFQQSYAPQSIGALELPHFYFC